MPTSLDLTDSEGFNWDVRSDPDFGLSILDGTSDAFDTGLQLRVDGVPINGAFSVDENGREVNVAPQLVGGVAVTRSILVSDPSISTSGFARFLESFTNTTDQAVTITVETITNSGADAALQFTATTSGDTTLTATDSGFVTDDGNTGANDPAVMFAYGDGTLLPTSAGVTNANAGLITVTHTLTLQPGETQSLLQFATQNTTATDGNTDLGILNNPNVFLFNPELLTGLSDAERLSVVNYAGAADGVTPPPATIIDSDGNRWGIDTLGRLSTLDSDALQEFVIPVLAQNFDELVSVTTDAATGDVTVVSTGFEGAPGTTVTHTYTALEGQGVIRLVVTIVGGPGGFAADMGPTVITGSNPLSVPAFVNAPDFGIPSGVVLDDSESGSGGTLPALTFVHGVTGADNVSSFGTTTYVNTMPGLTIGPGGTAQYLFFFALNDTGLEALADLTRLNTPSPEALIGLSAAEVAAFQNFDLDETDRLQTISGADDVDDILIGNAWGDLILGGSGDDDLSAGGSDDVVDASNGDDQVDGGDGNDDLFGGSGNDVIAGGLGSDFVDGGDDDDLLNGQTGNDTVVGGDGNDTLIGGSGTDILSGGNDNDVLSGNTGDDTLDGNFGNDTLNGGAGADSMLGGVGSDVFIVNDAGDIVTELSADAGTDEVRSSVTFTIGTQSIEAVTLTGTANINATGDINADHLVGNGGNNQLRGSGGADTLDGGDGTDTLIGGNGGDVYIIDSTTDTITELAGGTGIDEIRSSISFNFGVDNIELITLTGTGDSFVFGGDSAQRIVGNTGDNFLDGFAGADTLEGGDGEDNLFGGGDGDRLFGGAGNDSLDGGSAADRLEGGDGADSLNGGEGNDTLLGGTGSDTYTVDALVDRVFESAEAGAVDTVNASVTFRFGTQQIEVLNLTGTNNINGTGGAGDDILRGNSGNNVLDGGTGNDTMEGGDGNDTYFIRNAGDVVIENATANTRDVVNSFFTHTLATNFENLTLLGGGATSGNGNAVNNTIIGNSGSNTIRGFEGRDILTGNAGNDTFVFNTALNGTTNVDTITDYTVGEDRIHLRLTVFGELGLGAVSNTEFVNGTTALDGNDHLLYDSASGRIYFDANGNVAGERILFAIVDAGTVLSAADFFVIA